MIFNYANVKLYSNAVLASLNSRRDPAAVYCDEDRLKDRGVSSIHIFSFHELTGCALLQLNFAQRSTSRRPPVEVYS